MKRATAFLAAVVGAAVLALAGPASAQLRQATHLGETIFAPPGVNNGGGSVFFWGPNTVFQNTNGELVQVPGRVFVPFDALHLQALNFDPGVKGSPFLLSGEKDNLQIATQLVSRGVSGNTVRDLLHDIGGGVASVTSYPDGTLVIDNPIGGFTNRHEVTTVFPDGTTRKVQSYDSDGGKGHAQGVKIVHPDGSTESHYQHTYGTSLTTRYDTNEILPDGTRLSREYSVSAMDGKVENSVVVRYTVDPEGTITRTTAVYGPDGKLKDVRTFTVRGNGTENSTSTTVHTAYNPDGTITTTTTKDGAQVGPPVTRPAGAAPLPNGVSPTAPTVPDAPATQQAQGTPAEGGELIPPLCGECTEDPYPLAGLDLTCPGGGCTEGGPPPGPGTGAPDTCPECTENGFHLDDVCPECTLDLPTFTGGCEGPSCTEGTTPSPGPTRVAEAPSSTPAQSGPAPGQYTPDQVTRKLQSLKKQLENPNLSDDQRNVIQLKINAIESFSVVHGAEAGAAGTPAAR